MNSDYSSKPHKSKDKNHSQHQKLQTPVSFKFPHVVLAEHKWTNAQLKVGFEKYSTPSEAGLQAAPRLLHCSSLRNLIHCKPVGTLHHFSCSFLWAPYQTCSFSPQRRRLSAEVSAIIGESELLVLELKPLNHGPAVTFIHLYRKQTVHERKF